LRKKKLAQKNTSAEVHLRKMTIAPRDTCHFTQQFILRKFPVAQMSCNQKYGAFDENTGLGAVLNPLPFLRQHFGTRILCSILAPAPQMPKSPVGDIPRFAGKRNIRIVGTFISITG
jgi:hypothetical protein